MKMSADAIEALAEANYSNHIESLDYRVRHYIRRFDEGEFVRARGKNIQVHWCRLGAGAFNIVYGAELGADSGSKDAKLRVADITRRTSDAWDEPVRWFVSSRDQPRRLGAILDSEGWKHGFEWAEMGLEIGRYMETAGSKPSADIEVRRVRSESERLHWVSVQIAGYDLDERMAEYLDRSSASFHALSRQRMRSYLAWDQVSGKPLAAAAIFTTGETAGIYMVATQPTERRHGIGTALVRAMIHESQRFGCSRCVLQSSRQAGPLYHKLGFVETGATHIYLRGPSAA